eukprot:TRINITY_DN6828_c0_g1_i1.p1 TRINITY_DN6828_c0_g1~~TRINITY_DN6828_c0_g1_i1.p1  ORF type:complete len:386 (-),score=67.92 TRINITY_DN6828_c0_g1_i1:143-1300(-)
MDTPGPTDWRWWFWDKGQLCKACGFYCGTAICLCVMVFVGNREEDNDEWFDKTANYTSLHGVAQLVTWLLVVPAGTAIALFMRDRPWWLPAHQMLQSVATALQVPVIYAAYIGGNKTWIINVHQICGYVLGPIAILGTLAGTMLVGGPVLPFTRIRLSRWHRISPRTERWARKGHKIFGKVMLLLMVGQATTGLNDIYMYHVGPLPQMLGLHKCLGVGGCGLAAWLVVYTLLWQRSRRVSLSSEGSALSPADHTQSPKHEMAARLQPDCEETLSEGCDGSSRQSTGRYTYLVPEDGAPSPFMYKEVYGESLESTFRRISEQPNSPPIRSTHDGRVFAGCQETRPCEEEVKEGDGGRRGLRSTHDGTLLGEYQDRFDHPCDEPCLK